MRNCAHCGLELVRRKGEKPRDLNPDMVEEIRFMYALGRFTQDQLASQYNVTQTVISTIVRGESWRECPQVQN